MRWSYKILELLRPSRIPLQSFGFPIRPPRIPLQHLHTPLWCGGLLRGIHSLCPIQSLFQACECFTDIVRKILRPTSWLITPLRVSARWFILYILQCRESVFEWEADEEAPVVVPPLRGLPTFPPLPQSS